MKIPSGFDLRDAHCYGGLLLVAMGCTLYAPGAGLIAVGLGLFFLALRQT